MATAAAERPMTAQERVLSANNPPPRVFVQQTVYSHQRAAANSRGAGVAATFNPPAAPDAASPPPPRRGLSKPTSEFLAGPTEPGHVKHGVRRYEDKNTETVGMALTEDWIRGHGEDEPTPKAVVRQRGPRGNLDGPACNIKTEEPPYRPMRAAAAFHPDHTRGAPYYESEVPQEPLPKEPLAGKRRFPVKDNGDILSTPLPRSENNNNHHNDDDAAEHSSHRRNKANESRDVLNLGRYSAEQLDEKERKVVLGPREFTPQNLPPRQRPMIARVKSAANETHDIFGTGQGAKESDAVQCKRRGANAPKSSSHATLFDYSQPPKATPSKPYRPSDLLTYYEGEPRVAFKAEKKEQQPAAQGEPSKLAKKVEAGSLFTPSKKNDVPETHKGRGRGVYAPKANNIF